MSTNVHEVTFQNFEEIVDHHERVILDFWAPWCAPCRVFSPIFEAMADQFPEIYFGKVNTESSTELAQAFQVRAIPTLMAFQKGELVFEHAGLLQPQQFERLIEMLKTEKPKTETVSESD